MRDPQRFPVRIILPGYETGPDAEDDVNSQFNGQAEIVVLTGERDVLNMFGGW
ncbi:hypothetical protein [Aliiruegeria haliotis]|nr:hypothetical protein [Aliiruegeria haliotis]